MDDAILIAQEIEEGTEISVETSEVCADLGPVCNLLADWTGNDALAETVSWLLGTPVKLAIIVVGALLLNRWARQAISKFSGRLGSAATDSGDALVSERSRQRAEQRATTIGSLLRSLTSGVILAVAIIMIFEVFGISLMPIIAGAGLLSIAIGFGAQSTVEDFLRGFFMLAEDQFGVGDRIDVGDVNGYVERVTLRTTVIRDPDGILWHVPNSQVDFVANENQQSNRAVVEVSIPYGSDIRGAMKVLKEAADRACDDPEWQESVQRAPEVRGIQELETHDILVRVQVWVEPGDKRQFQRHLRLYLQEGLDESGLGSPNPTYDIRLREAAA
ncbi:MAG: mechanosensitive ion channel family protein [Acidimicrobiia bacterium]